jgi:hypothetical protein
MDLDGHVSVYRLRIDIQQAPTIVNGTNHFPAGILFAQEGLSVNTLHKLYVNSSHSITVYSADITTGDGLSGCVYCQLLQ